MSINNNKKVIQAFAPPTVSPGDPALSAQLQVAVKLHHSGMLHEAAETYGNILKSSPESAPALAFMAIIQANTGRLDVAFELLSRAIRLQPRLADAHFTLGEVLQAQKLESRAKTAYLSALSLGHPVAETRLENIYAILGDESRANDQRLVVETLLSLAQPLAAFNRIRKALDTFPDTLSLWELFSRCTIPIRFQSQAKKTVLDDLANALSIEGINHQFMVDATLSALRFEPVLESLLSAETSQDELRKLVNQRFESGELQSLGDNALFCGLLKVTMINDVQAERFLTALRRTLLDTVFSEASEEDEFPQGYMSLLCAIAQQCFLNEYIYPQSRHETDLVNQLTGKLVQRLESHQPVPPQWLAMISAYLPLFDLEQAEQLVVYHWPEALRDIVRQQLAERFEEDKIKHEIISLTEIRENVSKQTRSEYEAHPFPRWPSLPTLGPTQNFEAYLNSHLPDLKVQGLNSPTAPEILVAGCGTGLDACFLAMRISNSTVTGMDLSRSSLAFATRKSRSLDLDNIRFMHGDIVELDRTSEKYDFINCFGVLQLLENTEDGLRILRDRLANGGTMLIALYSTLGRQAVAWAREHIEAKGYQATAEDMRLCRQDLIKLYDHQHARALVDSLAFYNMSNFRDLVFHSTEKTFTLLQVRDMLDRLDLKFLGFEIGDPAIRSEYSRRFPQDTTMSSLENWHEFEQAFPDTFANCHAFWLSKEQ